MTNSLLITDVKILRTTLFSKVSLNQYIFIEYIEYLNKNISLKYNTFEAYNI